MLRFAHLAVSKIPVIDTEIEYAEYGTMMWMGAESGTVSLTSASRCLVCKMLSERMSGSIVLRRD